MWTYEVFRCGFMNWDTDVFYNGRFMWSSSGHTFKRKAALTGRDLVLRITAKFGNDYIWET